MVTTEQIEVGSGRMGNRPRGEERSATKGGDEGWPRVRRTSMREVDLVPNPN